MALQIGAEVTPLTQIIMLNSTSANGFFVDSANIQISIAYLATFSASVARTILEAIQVNTPGLTSLPAGAVGFVGNLNGGVYYALNSSSAYKTDLQTNKTMYPYMDAITDFHLGIS